MYFRPGCCIISRNNYDLLWSVVIQGEFGRLLEPSVYIINPYGFFLADAKQDIIRTHAYKHGHCSDRHGQESYIGKTRSFELDYSEFLNKFYLPDDGGGLVGYKSKKKIPMFFFEYGLDDDYNDDIIQPSDSTYEKWLNGTRRPEGTIWAEVIRSFDDGKLQKGLLATLNDNNLGTMMERFEISLEVGEPPDKLMFAKAITVQFHAIASGNGSAPNSVPAEYRKPPELKGFGTYLWEAKRNYRLMKLPGNEECQLANYFVCNNIGTSSAVFPHRIRGKYIEDATLPKIRKFDRRGEIRDAILIGACGYGKTLMLQHLFLEAADHTHETGILPIFAELRDFSSEHGDLLTFLAAAVQRFDLEFSKDKLVDLLEKGQAGILLDGLDEMDPVETNYFQRKLADFCHHYSNNQVVISSRQCSAISGIRGFTKLYIHPMDDDQSLKLIDKLLYDVEDAKAKEIILSFMDASKGYVRRNGFVATNPMLLTIIVKHYEEIQKLNGDKTRFYELLYDMLIRGHDEDKESFDRFFHSVGSSDEFTEVFREFCTLAYMDGIYEFDHRSFEKYFRQLKSRSSLQNQVIFTLTNFQHDVCATACMMYEQESGIYYIDPGFQDYFFAEYYYQQDTDATKDMGRKLWDRRVNSFRNLDALIMFHEIADEKVETCILLPYLESIFKGKSDDEAFLRYLSYGYGEVKYILLDKPQIDRFLKKPPQAEKFDMIPEPNHPKNVIIGLLYDILDLPNTFVIGSMDEIVAPDESTTHYIAGFYDNVEDSENEDIQHRWLRALPLMIEHIGDNQYIQDMESVPFPVSDDSTGHAAVFGYAYKVDPLSLLDKPDKQKAFLEVCNDASVRSIYETVKEFYQTVAEKQKVNEYR